MGKPSGLGRIRAEIEEITEFDVSKRYSVQSFSEPAVMQNSAEKYIEKYKRYASDMLEDSKIEENPEVQKFFAMHRISELPEEEMKYMTLEEIKAAKGGYGKTNKMGMEKKRKGTTVQKRQQISGGQRKKETESGELDLTGLKRFMKS